MLNMPGSQSVKKSKKHIAQRLSISDSLFPTALNVITLNSTTTLNRRFYLNPESQIHHRVIHKVIRSCLEANFLITPTDIDGGAIVFQQYDDESSFHLQDLGPSRVIHFTSEREFVHLLHQGHPVIVAFTIKSNYTKHLDKVLEEAAAEFYPQIKFMRVECPKYIGFCMTRQKKDYPFIEMFHSPAQASAQGNAVDPNVTKYAVKVLPFSVHSARTFIDDILLPFVGDVTRWVKVVPIKVNILAWKVCLDKLPTRLNLSLRGIDIPSIICPNCGLAGESCSHLFYSCNLARTLWRKIARWWEIDIPDFSCYEEWIAWFKTTRFSKAQKEMLEGVFYVMWWMIWKFRNQVLFGSSHPRMELLFDDIVSYSFTWCSNRCKNNIDWISWMKCPKSISL
ncbi:RNA-directed DNA polymerase, eukaryota [Tanacetum coccineum]